MIYVFPIWSVSFLKLWHLESFKVGQRAADLGMVISFCKSYLNMYQGFHDTITALNIETVMRLRFYYDYPLTRLGEYISQI